MNMKDVTGYVVRSKGIFLVDSEDVDTGKPVGIPGKKVKFKYRGKSFQATVTDIAYGRDDDVLELRLI